MDNTLDEGGFASFERGYFVGQNVTFTAAPTMGDKRFWSWRVNGVQQTPGLATIQITVPDTMTLQANYREVIVPSDNPRNPGQVDQGNGGGGVQPGQL